MKEVIRFLLSQVAPFKKEVLRLISWAVLAGLFSMTIPLLLSHGIDAATPTKSLMISRASVPPIGIALAWLLGWELSRYVSSVIGNSINRDSEILSAEAGICFFRSVTASLMRKPLSFHTARSNAKIAQGISQLRNDIEMFVSQTLFGFLPAMLMLIGSFLAVVFIEYRIAALLFVTIVMYAVHTNRTMAPLFAIRERYQESFQETTSYAFDSVSNVRLIKTMSAETSADDRLQKKCSALGSIILEEADASHRVQHMFSAIVLIGTGLATVLAVYLYNRNAISAGNVSAVVMYSATLLSQFQNIRPMMTRMLRTGSHLKTWRELQETPDEPYDTGVPKELFGAIRFEGVSFRYKAEVAVLDNVTFEIAPGEKIGIVGLSGAGKSTVTDLLSRIIDPISGTILFDGVPSQEIALRSIRAQVVVVPQEPEMIHASVHDNIAVSDPVGTAREDVRAAARKVQLDAFVSDQPLKYDTIVGDDGVRLSGGQRQRVGLARAFLGGPKPIIIFDEPTAQQDALTELGIQAALEALPKRTTVIMIAHRLRTLQEMDRILVLHEGRIADQGTHKELVERRGLYLKLLEAQGMEINLESANKLN